MIREDLKLGVIFVNSNGITTVIYKINAANCFLMTEFGCLYSRSKENVKKYFINSKYRNFGFNKCFAADLLEKWMGLKNYSHKETEDLKKA